MTLILNWESEDTIFIKFDSQFNQKIYSLRSFLIPVLYHAVFANQDMNASSQTQPKQKHYVLETLLPSKAVILALHVHQESFPLPGQPLAIVVLQELDSHLQKENVNYVILDSMVLVGNASSALKVKLAKTIGKNVETVKLGMNV